MLHCLATWWIFDFQTLFPYQVADSLHLHTVASYMHALVALSSVEIKMFVKPCQGLVYTVHVAQY